MKLRCVYCGSLMPEDRHKWYQYKQSFFCTGLCVELEKESENRKESEALALAKMHKHIYNGY